MRFLELSIQNFLAFGAKQTVNLAGQGLVAVLGQNQDTPAADSNGAGKSSLMEALVWVLYGETMRDYKADEVINKTAQRDCVVSLSLEDENKNNWRITRSRGLSAKRSNDLELLSNGVDPRQAGITADTQELIETLVGMDKQTFVQSVLMCYGTKPFAELTDGEKKGALESVLQIEQFAKARDIVGKRVREKQNLLAAVQMDMQNVVLAADQVRQRCDRLVVSRDQHESMVRQRRMELLKRKTQCELRIDEQLQSGGLDKLLATMKDMEERVTTYRGQDDQLGRNIINSMRMLNQVQTPMRNQEAMLVAKRQQYSDDCVVFNDLVGKACPTCKRGFEFDEAEELLKVWDDVINQLDSQLQELRTKIVQTQDAHQYAVETMEANQKLLRAELANLQAQQQMLHGKIQQRSASLQLICQLEQQVFNLGVEIDELDSDTNPYASLVDEAQEEIKKLESRLQRLTYRQRALDVEIRHLLFWEHGFGNQGLKSFVIEGVLPFLNQRAQHYADLMTGGDVRIAFTAQKMFKNKNVKEELELHVTNRHGAEVYKGNSDGEKRRINTAIGWAFGDLAATRAKKPILFKGLDEPFENLDETGEDLVVRLLHAVLPQYETILCVTHSDHLRNQFPKTLTVVKQGGFARVEV